MKKGLLIGIISLVLLGGLFFYEFTRFNDGLLHVVFCDVGQGDAIFIRTPNSKHILIDGGPDRKVLNCLSSHMPFWERKIDLVILTHPHADHFIGMQYVLDRYDVTGFATEKLKNKSGGFQALMKMLKEKNVPVQYVVKGDRWIIEKGTTGNVLLSVLGPTEEFIYRTSPNGEIGDSKEFASLILDVSYGDPSTGTGQDFHAIFTGDTQAGEMAEAINHLDYPGNQIDVLQSPHHGSRTGLTKEIVQKIMPKMAVISVGQYNRYGHPNKVILDLFEKAQVPVLRTDKMGDIEIIVDELGWRVQK